MTNRTNATHATNATNAAREAAAERRRLGGWLPAEEAALARYRKTLA